MTFTTTPIATAHVSGTEGSNNGLVRSWGIQDSGATGRDLIKTATPAAAREALEFDEEYAPEAGEILGTLDDGTFGDITPFLLARLEAQLGAGSGVAATADFAIPYQFGKTSYARVIDATLTITDVTPAAPSVINSYDAGMTVFLIHGAGGPFFVTWDETKFFNAVPSFPLNMTTTPGMATAFKLYHPPSVGAKWGVAKFPVEFEL